MAVLAHVMLAGFFGVGFGVDLVAICHPRVMGGRFVVATFVMFGCRLMMPGGMLVMLSGFAVMLGSLLGHGIPPRWIISVSNFKDVKMR